MYMVLARETADVDPSWFEKAGHMKSEILVFPTTHQTIALKGSVSSSLDHGVVDCQNTLFLHWDADANGPDAVTEVGAQDFENSFQPGWIYQYCGDEKAYKGQNFVELKWATPLGEGFYKMMLTAYFLVPVSDCEFAVYDEICGITPCTFPELWKEGYIKRAK